ncbi:imidazolonepropionase-like amidohydrolase [Sphingomonas jinjuensis]|uniref:Imidazolonepropionase-like amidohydrolase n=1 Tax=Sphingomonas jinjuensis TaxID=535907 RepID=A0A840FBA8_9SPHN|nr:amidohydrolase family protein [Sphingomonas jinjuensis]MBB4153526.1 imidazolonepropionase-like amidohydrolase [Sphingomonas jinjuensis]
MRRLVPALAASALLGAAPVAGRERADLLIRHVAVVDVEHGRTLPDQAVAVRGDTIVASGRDSDVAGRWQGARWVEGRGRFLIPGLWDMHVHFGGGPALVAENEALLPLYIANGVTTVRDCAGDLPNQVLAWREAVRRGTLTGPTIYTSGPKIEGLKPIWKGTLETGSEADVDAAVSKLKALDVDFVKITDSTLDPKLFLYAVGAARRAGLPVSGHIPMADTIEQALDAGISSIEHLDYAFKPGAPDEAAIAADFAAGRITRAEADRRIDEGFDPAVAAKAWRTMAAKGVAVTPTLLVSRTIAYLDRDDHSRDAYLAYIGPGLRQTYQWRVDRAAKATPAEIARRHAHVEKMAAILPGLRRAGVTIMAGTDAGFLNSFDYPGQALHDELALYVRYGLTPAEALASATRAGPGWFGKLDRYGAVARGKAADLVLLKADPLKDISATRGVDAVVLRGKLYDRKALDALLAATRAKVAAWNRAR